MNGMRSGMGMGNDLHAEAFKRSIGDLMQALSEGDLQQIPGLKIEISMGDGNDADDMGHMEPDGDEMMPEGTTMENGDMQNQSPMGKQPGLGSENMGEEEPMDDIGAIIARKKKEQMMG